MVLSVLIVFIILFIYLKYPQVFSFKQTYLSGKYIRLDRESGSDPINFANFIIKDDEGSIIIPNEVSVNPTLAFGNGRNPKSKGADVTDVILIETGGSGTPYVEYDLGSTRNIANVIIVNRKKYNDRMNKTVLRVLDDDRNQIFEKKISDIQDIYSINIS